MTDDLLEAIDALTAPVRTRVLQDGMGAITIVRPSLLEQLGAAVTASMGASGGAHDSSPASQRNMLDSEAEYQYRIMVTQIESWGRIRKLQWVYQQPAGILLRRWYDAHVLVEGHEDTFYTQKIWSWVRLIEAKMDPPKRKEITDACPVCGKESWMDHEGNAFRFPLVVVYRDLKYDEGAGGDLTQAEAICRACEHAWKGEFALRRLRWDIDTRNA